MAEFEQQLENAMARTQLESFDITMKEVLVLGTSFSKFLELPLELQRKIWGWAAMQSRLIELEIDPIYRFRRDNKGHQYTRVSWKSGYEPEFLMACKEAREEGKKYFVNFKQHFKMPTKGRYVYYNPASDVVFFGDRTCNRSIAGFVGKGIEVRRVAIDMETCERTCCPMIEDDEYEIAMGNGVFRGMTAMHALHGFDAEMVEGCRKWKGCKGLQEITLVVPGPQNEQYSREELDKVKTIWLSPQYGNCQGGWSDSWIIRGLAYKARKVTERIIATHKKGTTLSGVGTNRWTGNNKPTIRLMSLYAGKTIERISFRVTVMSKDYPVVCLVADEINRNVWEEPDGFTNVVITGIPHMKDGNQEHDAKYTTFDMSFWGGRVEIEKGIAKVMRELNDAVKMTHHREFAACMAEEDRYRSEVQDFFWIA